MIQESYFLCRCSDITNELNRHSALSGKKAYFTCYGTLIYYSYQVYISSAYCMATLCISMYSSLQVNIYQFYHVYIQCMCSYILLDSRSYTFKS